MRLRTILLIVAIVLLAVFVAINLDEFTRPSLLSLGFTTVSVSLGLVMLLLLVVATVIFLATTIYMQSNNLLETRSYARELSAQRELADKAEASRFTELRVFLENRLDLLQTLPGISASPEQSTLTGAAQSQQFDTLMARIEQSDNTLAAFMGQLEDRLERNNSLPTGPLLK